VITPASPWPAAVVAQVVDRLLGETPRAGNTRVLAVDGRSGAGKSSLTAAVAASLIPAPAVVHLEDLYDGWDGLAAGPPRLYDEVLKPLAEHRPLSYRRYDWHRGEYAEWVDVPVTPVLIVEGVGAGSRPGAELISLLVYLDTPEPVRFERAMARDGDTYRPHWERWARQEQELLAADDPRSRAGLILGSQRG
jgi:uridine kinase